MSTEDRNPMASRVADAVLAAGALTVPITSTVDSLLAAEADALSGRPLDECRAALAGRGVRAALDALC